MHHYPNLRDETEHILTGFLRDQEQNCKEQVKLMMDIELSYMNTNHPDFIGFQKWVLFFDICAYVLQIHVWSPNLQ